MYKGTKVEPLRPFTFPLSHFRLLDGGTYLLIHSSPLFRFQLLGFSLRGLRGPTECNTFVKNAIWRIMLARSQDDIDLALGGVA